MRVFLLLFLFISAFCSPRGPQNSASGSRVDSGGPTSFRYTIHNYQTPRYEQLTLTLVSTSSALHFYFVRFPHTKTHSITRRGQLLSFTLVSLIAFAFLVSFIVAHKVWPLVCCISHSLCQFLYFIVLRHNMNFKITPFESRLFTPSHSLPSEQLFIAFITLHLIVIQRRTRKCGELDFIESW